MKKKKNITQYTLSEIQKSASDSHWKRVDKLRDAEIDISDAPALHSGFWDVLNTKLVKPKKRPVTLRLEPHVLEWFQAQDKPISTMQAVLAAFAESHHRPTFR